MWNKIESTLVFFSGYLLIALGSLGIYIGSIYNWTGVFTIFVVLPIMEFCFPHWKFKNSPSVNFFSELWLFLSPLVLTIFLVWSGFQYVHLISGYDKLGLILSVGALTGALGITIAHELVHRKEAWQRALGVWNLLLVNFGHWGVEHVFGHHKSVGTPDDHASALKNQSLYHFLVMDYFGGLLNSFRFEKKRISGKSFSFFRNRIVNYFIFAILVSYLLLAYNSALLVFWWGQSIVAIILLLAVDYIEHYGLRRKVRENGHYEPVGVQHSWDTESFITNILLFNLGLHSHHHMKARLPYQELKAQPDARYMPYGYSVMLLMAFIPPLYFKKMNRLLN